MSPDPARNDPAPKQDIPHRFTDDPLDREEPSVTDGPPGEVDEPVIIEDTEDGPPAPRARPRLPYGRGYVRRDRPAEPTAPRERRGTSATRLTILDTWMRSGLPAGDFAPLVGVSKHTLYAWKQRFEAEGPAGLGDRPRGARRGSRLPEITKRAILLMKQLHPEWGIDRLSDLLLRSEGLQASPSAVAQVLRDEGYAVEQAPQHVHRDHPRFFERAAPNQLWQTDLFTFVLKRQNQRVYLVAFLDDHARFIVSYGLHASQSTALVLEALRAGIASYGAPQEILTDNGTQYVTWRGTSQFQAECQKRGIRQIVAAPRHPQTLGKIERFWGTLWRECVEAAVFADLGDARLRIGHFIDHYNFQRTHAGIDGMVPADRFFAAAPAVLDGLRARVAANALELARHGTPKAPLYLAGNVGGTPVVLHAEGDRVILSKDGQRAEIAFDPRPSPAEVPPAPPAPAMPAAPSPAAGAAVPPPVAPAGSVSSAWTGAQDPGAPGTSPLDALLPPSAPGGQP